MHGHGEQLLPGPEGGLPVQAGAQGARGQAGRAHHQLPRGGRDRLRTGEVPAGPEGARVLRRNQNGAYQIVYLVHLELARIKRNHRSQIEGQLYVVYLYP